MRFILIGRGRMGTLIRETAQAAGDEVIAAFDVDDIDQLASFEEKADAVIDFSNPASLPYVCAYIQRTGTPLLSGTTGMSAEQKAMMEALGAYAPVLSSSNYSLGVAVLYRALKVVSDTLKADFDIEITETHHNQKVDAPSGTAKLLLDAIDPAHDMDPVYGREGVTGKRTKKEIGMHALRGGTVAGVHTVHFFGPDEELEFTHRATSRQIFVNGALHMARLLPGKANGVYDLQTLLFGE